MSALRECEVPHEIVSDFIDALLKDGRPFKVNRGAASAALSAIAPAVAAWNRRAGDDGGDAVARLSVELTRLETKQTDYRIEIDTLRAELAAAREIEQRSRDFLRWVTANGFTDPENMLVCAEWENLRTALGDTP